MKQTAIKQTTKPLENILPKTTKSQIKIIDLLRDPTFVDYQEIREVFFKYRHKDTYKRIINLYFGRQRWIETE